MPCNDESYIEWKSGNTGVATIDRYGKVVPKRDGVAKITASAGGASASCLLYVNSKPLVRVEQHEGYFSATFDGHALGKGRIWRSIGCDLTDPANRSQTKDIYNAEAESSLNSAELRHLRNFEQNFTVEQFNVLYRLDPLGVIFYVKEHARLRCHGLVEQLEYKDSAYLAIFKRSSRFEYKFVDGVVDFRGVSNLPRDQKHTLAEGVFGGYTEWNWNAFWKEFFWSIVEHLPVISQALSAIQLSQALFFADSFGDATSIVMTVLTQADTDENEGKRLGKLFGWIKDTFEVISSATQSAYVHPSEYSVCIYNSLKECNYRVTMKTGSKIVPVELLIDHSQ